MMLGDQWWKIIASLLPLSNGIKGMIWNNHYPKEESVIMHCGTVASLKGSNHKLGCNYVCQDSKYLSMSGTLLSD